jgi:hypothetical protein
MLEAVPDAHYPRDARQRSSEWRFARTLWCASLIIGCLSGARAGAQLPPTPPPLPNTEDARTLPKGGVQLRIRNVWTLFDQVFDRTADSANPRHPLGQAFSAESLGVRQFPALAATQNALRTLTGNPNLLLNLGQQFSTVNTRVVTTPLSLSYGVTDRLTIGAMVPIVQTHSTVFVELNPRRLNGATGANVGPNSTSATSTNQALLQALTDASNALNDYITNCGQSGSCSPASVSNAQTLKATADSYQAAAQLLYGSNSAFVPRGAAQAQIATQLTTLADNINALLGTTITFVSAGANADAALAQLQQLATANPGVALDSLGSPDQIGTGNVELSALFKLVDGFADTTSGFRLRGTVSGVVRLPTGFGPSGGLAYEVGTGTGQTSVDAGGILDIGIGNRLVATVGAEYTAYLTSSSVPRMPNSDYALFPLDAPVAGTWREGNALQLQAAPRIRFTDYFTFNGMYMIRHQNASQYTSPDVTAPPVILATTEQNVGLGFSYSAVARYASGRSPLPIEMTYTHLETIAASGGLVPKYNRDMVEVRIYYRLFRRGR